MANNKEQIAVIKNNILYRVILNTTEKKGKWREFLNANFHNMHVGMVVKIVKVLPGDN